MLKVGFELFWAHGPEAVRRVAAHAPGLRGREAPRHPEHGRTRLGQHRAARRGDVQRARAGRRGDDARGGARRERAATASRHVAPPIVIAVTVLVVPVGRGSREPGLARVRGEGRGPATVSSCLGRRRRDVRAACGDAFVLVVPGVRPEGSNGHDQVRVLTPRAAIEKGADYLVVGRPITEAADPAGVARAILCVEIVADRLETLRTHETAGSATDPALSCDSWACVYSPAFPTRVRPEGAHVMALPTLTEEQRNRHSRRPRRLASAAPS